MAANNSINIPSSVVKLMAILILLTSCSAAWLPLEKEVAEDVVENVMEDISKHQKDEEVKNGSK